MKLKSLNIVIKNNLWLFSFILGVLSCLIVVMFVSFFRVRYGDRTSILVSEQNEKSLKVSPVPKFSPSPVPPSLPPLTAPIAEGIGKQVDKFGSESYKIPHHPGWRTYEDIQHEIQFDFPPHLLVIPNEKSIILVNPNTLGVSQPRAYSLLEITDEFFPMTYGSILEPDEIVTNDLDPVVIQGSSYPFSKYTSSEGYLCGGGSVDSYTIRLDEYNILIYDRSQLKMCDDEGNELSEGQYERSETRQIDLEYARQVLETIRPIDRNWHI